MIAGDFYASGGLLPAIAALALVIALVSGLAGDGRGDGQGGERGGRGAAWMLVAGMTVLIGTRPLIGLYIDMQTYARIFRRFANGYWTTFYEDVLFDVFTRISAAFLPIGAYFFLCALLYVFPKALATRRLFGPNWPIAFAVMASSFSFYAYATNGIRNGIATSFALMALAIPRLVPKLLWGIAAAMVHLSVLLTFLAHAIALRLRSIPLSLAFWLVSIPVSLVLPNAIVGDFVESIGDTRSDYFTRDEVEVGLFRWDFILYSGLGTAAIAYWYFIRKVRDDAFILFGSTYLIANGGWILVNDVAYSNRFAYLSWFMLELAILFPMLRERKSLYLLPAALALIVGNFLLSTVIL